MIIVITNALVLNFVQNATFSTTYCICKNTKNYKKQTGLLQTPRLSRPAKVPKGTFPEYKRPPGSHPALSSAFVPPINGAGRRIRLSAGATFLLYQIHYADNLSFRPFFPPCFLIRFCLPPSPFCSIRIIILPPRIRINAVRSTAASVQPQ